jgi:flagellar basal-body rod protein FlgF
MEAASYVALSSQVALGRQLDVVANNMANASTPGYKAERGVFAEFIDRQRPSGTNALSFVQDLGTARDTTQGGLALTGNSLDLAVQGNGYFTVQTPLGPRYTRNGHFQLDAQGQVVNSQGYAVLAEGNQPLTVPTDAKDITISREGTVTTAQGEAGRIQVAQFADERALTPAAGGLYVTDAVPTKATDAAVLQGMIENSNVEPILEMTRMMSIARNFSSAKDFGDSESDRARNAIDKLGKVA